MRVWYHVQFRLVLCCSHVKSVIKILRVLPPFFHLKRKCFLTFLCFGKPVYTSAIYTLSMRR